MRSRRFSNLYCLKRKDLSIPWKWIWEILNGIFYVQRTGCQWEIMPHDLPPCNDVYSYFHKWQHKGTWQQMYDQIWQQLRTKLGRDEQSTVAIADSQSVKTTEKREQSMVSMVAKRLKDVSVISSSIRKGCWLEFLSVKRMLQSD